MIGLMTGALLFACLFGAIWFFTKRGSWMQAQHAVEDFTSTGWSIAVLKGDGAIAMNIGAPSLIIAVVMFAAIVALTLTLRSTSATQISVSKDTEAALQDVQGDVSERLDQSLSTVLELVHSTIAANGRYSNVLAKAENDLSSMVRPEDVKAAVKSLLVENKTIRNEVDSLKDRLEAAHIETRDLRSELMSAQKLMFVDNLTGLNNRRWFDGNFSMQVAAAHASNTTLCLAMGELDNFEAVNDTFGYQSGDRILNWFGNVLIKHRHRGDAAVRFGGNAFALVVRGRELRQVTEVIESIRCELQQTRWIHQESGRDIGVLTGSFGVVQLKPDEGSETVLKRALKNLSSARTSGRNRIVTTG